MTSLDIRTRTVADIRTVDVRSFFDSEPPQLLNERSHFAAAGAAEFSPQPLTISTEAGSWTLADSADGFTVSVGASGFTTIQLSDNAFSDLVNEIATLAMLFNLGCVDLLGGSRDEAHCWAAILRSIIDMRLMHTSASVEMLGRDAQPLDLSRSFTPDADRAAMAQFLAQTGFLHLSGWLSQDLMREIADEMDLVFARATPEVGSWWVDLEDGSRRPARILDFGGQSAALGRVVQSDTFQRLGRLTDDDYRWTSRVEALQKPIGVVRGISDIPWHTDCATGMHSYVCRDLTVGIQVTGAGPGSAHLEVLPGSHMALMPTDRHYPSMGFQPHFRLRVLVISPFTARASCTLRCRRRPTNERSCTRPTRTLEIRSSVGWSLRCRRGETLLAPGDRGHASDKAPRARYRPGRLTKLGD